MMRNSYTHTHIYVSYAEERKHIEAYQTLVRLFKTAHIDNMKILRALFYAKDGLPLYNCSSGKKVWLIIELIIMITYDQFVNP